MNYEKGSGIPGRSSSQISIYDYPEHLNPFAEDDNHKRLRFWKINSSSKPKLQRSNSFTLSGLKDIWSFKTFRLKKKSSTLGINKTSESPPILRRDLVYPVNNNNNPTSYNTVDSRIRHTVNVGLGHPSNFQRGVGYRSSLQDVLHNGRDTNFNRNDRYRSTVQNGYQTLATPQSNRYHLNGSLTPTTTLRSTRYGSSQSSLNSTNPFDDEFDDDNISQMDVQSIDGNTSLRKPRRKKRRAPPPPVNHNNVTSASIHHETIPTLEETSREDSSKEDIAEISNLTAEIESFVRIADTDKAKLRDSPEKSTKSKTDVTVIESRTIHTTASPTIENFERINDTSGVLRIKEENIVTNSDINRVGHNGHVKPDILINRLEDDSVKKPDLIKKPFKEDRKEVACNTNELVKCEQRTYQTNEEDVKIENKKHKSDVIIRGEIVKRRTPALINTRESPENNEEYPERMSQTPDRESSPKLQKFHSEKQLNNIPDHIEIASKKSHPPKIIIRKATEDYEQDQVFYGEATADDKEIADICQTPKKTHHDNDIRTPRSSEVEFILEQEHNKSIQKSPKKESQPAGELKITESTDDLTQIASLTNIESYQIRYVPLKNFTPSPQLERRRETIQTPFTLAKDPKVTEYDMDDIDLPPAPPVRRRSVRDIIASINKSQSLLKINQNQNQSNSNTSLYGGSFDRLSLDNNSFVANNNRSTESTESIARNMNDLTARESDIRKMISEMEHSVNSKRNTEIPIPVEKFNELNNNSINSSTNNEIFKKCNVRRKESIDSSDDNSTTTAPLSTSTRNSVTDTNRPSLEWNPLPKPRRTKHLSNEKDRKI